MFVLKIRGGKLKIVGDNPEIGVYFLEKDGKPHKVEEKDIIVNKPAELIVMIPKMSAGPYRLQICSQFGQGAMLKEPRSTIYEKELTAQ